jgi:hypothetical protein
VYGNRLFDYWQALKEWLHQSPTNHRKQFAYPLPLYNQPFTRQPLAEIGTEIALRLLCRSGSYFIRIGV